jgi:hypothetical protein
VGRSRSDRAVERPLAGARTHEVHYRRYLQLEGTGSIVLGLAMAIVAWPGLRADYRGAWAAIPIALGLLLVLAAFARLRNHVPLLAPGRWLTDRSIAHAQPGARPMPESPLRRRLMLESGLWIVLVCGWVLATGHSGWLVFVTGWASVAYGVLQVAFSARRVQSVERHDNVTFLVARRPGLGTPELTT